LELNGAVQIEKTAMQFQRNSWKTEKLSSQATEQASLLTVALPSSFLVSVVLTCFCDLFLSIARKVDEAANFVFRQFIEQEPGIYDKCHADYSRQDKIDMA
jgi:hypothetical protein